MQALYNFVVEPIGKRYNNTAKVGDKELILNTDVFNHVILSGYVHKVIVLCNLLRTIAN